MARAESDRHFPAASLSAGRAAKAANFMEPARVVNPRSVEGVRALLQATALPKRQSPSRNEPSQGAEIADREALV